MPLRPSLIGGVIEDYQNAMAGQPRPVYSSALIKFRGYVLAIDVEIAQETGEHLCRIRVLRLGAMQVAVDLPVRELVADYVRNVDR